MLVLKRLIYLYIFEYISMTEIQAKSQIVKLCFYSMLTHLGAFCHQTMNQSFIIATNDWMCAPSTINQNKQKSSFPIEELFHIEVALQSLHIVLKSFQSCGRDAADGARLLALEGLFNLDVACRREFVNLYTQVASRGSRLLLDVRELGFLGTDEQRHDGESQLRVQ